MNSLFNLVIFIVFLLALFLTSYASEQGLTVEVPPGRFQCFFQPVENDKFKTMEVDFQVRNKGAVKFKGPLEPKYHISSKICTTLF